MESAIPFDALTTLLVFMVGVLAGAVGDGVEVLVVLGLTSFAVLNAIIWFFIGVHSFEGSMLNATAKRARGLAG